MRSFYISVIALGLVIGSWGIFIIYANESIDTITSLIKNEAIIEINQENWEKAEVTMDKILLEWSKSRKAFTLFLNAQSIGEIEGSLFRAQAYIYAQEKPSSLGELAYINQQLFFLMENERVTLENVI